MGIGICRRHAAWRALVALAVAITAGLAAVAVVAGPARAEIYTSADFAPAAWSQRPVYAPGAEVLLAGANWQPGESVHITVNDDQSSTWQRTADVTADDAGNIADRFDLPGWFVAHYTITATGASGLVATSAFDDDAVKIISPLDASSQNSSTWPNAISGTTNGSNTDSAKISIKRPDGQYWNGSAWSATTENLQALTLNDAGGQSKTWSYPFPAVNHQSTGTYVVKVYTYSGPRNVSQLATATSSYSWGVACTAPSVTRQPASQTVSYGDNASFSLAATGTPIPTVRWQRSTDGSNWSDVPNETATSLTVTTPAVAQSGTAYRAQISNGCGTATTNGAATLTVDTRAVTGTFAVASKTYDATTDATITGRSLNGALVGDVVSLSGGTAAFADKNAGTAKAVSGSGFSLTGAAADNYTLASVATTTANITARTLTGSFTAADKVYDGTVGADVLRRDLTGVLGVDTVSLTGGAATFADENVGAGKTVTLSGATLGGADAGNYDLASVATAAAAIKALAISGQFTARDKVYDGNVSAEVLSRDLTGVLNGDTVSLTGGTATFADKNVGVDKTVSLTGATLDGEQAGNYTLTGVVDATAMIKKLPVTGSWKAEHKVYDGTPDATIVDRALSGAVTGDKVELGGGTAAFADKNVGVDKQVHGSGFALTGDDAANYDLNPVNATATASITPLEVAGVITVADKAFDGTTAATVTSRDLTGVLKGDTVSLTGGTATFDSALAGERTATLTGAVLEGADKANYALSSAPITAKAAIRAWAFKGFLAPIDMKTAAGAWIYNTAKVGSAIPVKFSLGGDKGLNVFASGFPKTTTVACSNAPTTAQVEELAAGTTSGLKYDATNDQYNYTWKTAATLAGKCVRLDVQFIDGQMQQAYFNFTK